MKRNWSNKLLAVLGIAVVLWAVVTVIGSGRRTVPAGREPVVFWHFWGGAERGAVRDIVARFNHSQDRYWVEEIPVPGQNLDMKFFMALAGGDYPDLLNQDDQIVAQWADRGVLTPIRELTAGEAEYRDLTTWLSPAATSIGTYEGELFALCNAVDVRALIYRVDAVGGAPPPRTIAEFDAIFKRQAVEPGRIMYLPDDRRLWAWGTVFGGTFYDAVTDRATVNDPRIVAALEWMASYTEFHGLQQIRAFRSTNRETGAGSMILDGRYATMMDGQWRVAELDQARQQAISRGDEPVDYGVVPLPAPTEGRPNAGWVNGNFFVVPRGCKNPAGAWEFMKFWSGFGGHEAEAAASAAAGGWIPASRRVVEQPAFQDYLDRHPNFRTFVELAESPYQVPTPAVPIQAYFYERVNRAAEEALSQTKTPRQALDDAARDIQQRLDAVRDRNRKQERASERVSRANCSILCPRRTRCGLQLPTSTRQNPARLFVNWSRKDASQP